MFSDAIISKQGDRYSVNYGNPDTTFVEFYHDAIIDDEQTKIAGRPVYRNVEMVRIINPGDTKTEKTGLAKSGNPPYNLRYAKQYEAFKAQQVQVQNGTPIEHWPPIDKAMALNLKGMNIHTVEQLAAVSDQNLWGMGARQLRENAKAWLSEAESGAEVIKMRNKIAELELQLEAMKNQNAGFSSSEKLQESVLSTNEAAPTLEADVKPIVRKMRGRPKKVLDGENISSTDTASGE